MTQLRSLAHAENKRAKTLGCLISVAIALSIGFTLMYVAGLLHLGDAVLVLMLPAFAVALAVGFFINRYAQRQLNTRWNRMLEGLLEEPNVTISQAELRPGDLVNVAYDQRMLQEVKVRSFTIDLVRRTHEAPSYADLGILDPEPRHWDHSTVRVQRPGGEYRALCSLHEDVTLTIPAQRVSTLTERALGRHVVWLIRTRLRILRAPDFIREYLLEAASTSS